MWIGIEDKTAFHEDEFQNHWVCVSSFAKLNFKPEQPDKVHYECVSNSSLLLIPGVFHIPLLVHCTVDTQFRHKWSHKCVALFVHTCENDSESLSLYLPPHPVQLYYYSHGFFLHVALVGGSNTKYTWRWGGWLTDWLKDSSFLVQLPCPSRVQMMFHLLLTRAWELFFFKRSEGEEIYKIHHIAHTISQLINWSRLKEFYHDLKARNESSVSLNIYLN